MARTFTAVPPDSTGDKLWMRSQTISSDVLHEQAVFAPGLPTFRAMADNVVPANNKYHLLLRNNTGSGQTVWITGLYMIHVGVTAVTGVLNRFDLRRVTYTTATGGAAITPVAFNTADPSLSNVDAYNGATAGVTDVNVIRPVMRISEEGTALTTNLYPLMDELNLMPPPPAPGRPFALRPGEAFGVKQNGAGTVGTMTWFIDFTVEAD